MLVLKNLTAGKTDIALHSQVPLLRSCSNNNITMKKPTFLDLTTFGLPLALAPWGTMESIIFQMEALRVWADN